MSRNKVILEQGAQDQAWNGTDGKGHVITYFYNPDTMDYEPSTGGSGTGTEVEITNFPANPATSTLQTAGNASLTNLDTNLGAKADVTATSDIGTFSLIALIKRLLSVNIGAVSEVAPASDTAASGLNGRLQRIAQNLTTLDSTLGTGTGTDLNKTVTGTLANNTTDTVEIATNGCSAVMASISGTIGGATIAFQGTSVASPGASDWYAITGISRVATSNWAQSATSTGNYLIHAAGCTKVRLIKTVAGSTTLTVNLSASNAVGMVIPYTQNYNGFLGQFAPSNGSFTDRSGTATSATTQVAAASSFRKYFMIQNLHASDALWINFGVNATAASPSIKVAAGATFTMEGTWVSTQAINVIRGGAADISFTAKEGF
jgi:hypothetical protein